MKKNLLTVRVNDAAAPRGKTTAEQTLDRIMAAARTRGYDLVTANRNLDLLTESMAPGKKVDLPFDGLIDVIMPREHRENDWPMGYDPTGEREIVGFKMTTKGLALSTRLVGKKRRAT